MNEYKKKNYPELDQRVYIIWHYLCKTLENVKQIWRNGKGPEGGVTEWHKETFGDDGCVLIVMTVSWLYTYAKT